MTDQVTVGIERDAPPETVGAFFVSGVEVAAVAATEVRQRFSCGKGCGFVVNVN